MTVYTLISVHSKQGWGGEGLVHAETCSGTQFGVHMFPVLASVSFWEERKPLRDVVVCNEAVRCCIRGCVSEQRVSWAERVSADSLCSVPAALPVNGVHGRKCDPHDPLCRLYDSLESLPLSAWVPEQSDEMLGSYFHCGSRVWVPARGRCHLQSQESVALGPLSLRRGGSSCVITYINNVWSCNAIYLGCLNAS